MSKKNILIVNVSLLKKIESNTYSFDINGVKGTVEGMQTNESPTKCIISVLENEKLDKIIMLETKEVQENEIDVNGEKVTTHNYFVNAIENFCKEKGYHVPSFESVEWGKNLGDALSKIIVEIHKGDNVYVDTTGGNRTYSDWVNSVINYLKYSDVRYQFAMYTDFNQKEVIRVNREMLDRLIKGAEEFTTTGKCENFVEIFGKSDDNNICALINAMKEFSEKMTLCNVKDIDKTVAKIKAAIVRISKCEYTDQAEILLQMLLPTIWEKLNVDKDNNTIEMINWCLGNDLIQQALTLYESKIPSYILQNKKIISMTDDYRDYAYKEYKNAKGFVNDFNSWLFYVHTVELCSKDEMEIKNFCTNLENKYVNKKAVSFLSKHENIANAFEQVYNSIGDDLSYKRVKAAKSNSISKFEINIYEFILSNKNTYQNFNKMISDFCSNKRNVKRTLCLPVFEKEQNFQEKLYKIINMKFDNLPNGVTINVSEDKLKKIYFDYALIKTMRNTINHALGEKNKDLALFMDCGYTEEQTKFSMDNIKERITEALKTIDEG